MNDEDLEKKLNRFTDQKRKTEKLAAGVQLLGEHYYADRIRDCSGRLVFSRETKTGEMRIKSAYRCHIRTCPICARGAAWKRVQKFTASLPLLREAHPKARWLFLTLTVGVCEIEEVRSRVEEMHEAFARLKDRKRWPGIAWFRFTEVARSGELVQPHIHAVVLVKPSYFNGQNYLSRAAWAELWMDCARLPFSPEVDCQLVGRDDEENRLTGCIYYASKIEEFLKKEQEQDCEWLAKVTLHLKRLRLVQSGGDLLRLKPENRGSIKSEYQGDELIYGWTYGRYVPLEKVH
ncbi:MAG TPA: protein rep [Thermoanaerobaculia bacterium]|jgi:plasmid rolling circle replication initiator protein Rep|nr:protein rep [Thermoanaerobaculia bacterium]